MRCINLYSSGFSKHLHGKNQPSGILLAKEYAFYSCNWAILDPDPVTRF